MNPRRGKRRGPGFTLIELLVVVLIIGILAAIAVPQYVKVVERGRAAEGVGCVSIIIKSQQRHYLKHNTFAAGPAELDMTCPAMKNFTFSMTGGGAGYQLQLTRTAPLPPVYGGYIITYNGPDASWVCSPVECQADLMP